MLILFDNGTPAPLRHELKNHVVVEAIVRGWDRLANGALIAAAEEACFEVLLTTDRICAISKISKTAKSRLWCLATSSGRYCVATSIG